VRRTVPQPHRRRRHRSAWHSPCSSASDLKRPDDRKVGCRLSLRVAPYRRPPHFEIECAHHALALSRLPHRDPTQLYREPARSSRRISVPRVPPGPPLRPIREPDGPHTHRGSGLAGPSSAVTLHGETADVVVAERVRQSVNFVIRVDAVLRRGRSSCAGRSRAATHHA